MAWLVGSARGTAAPWSNFRNREARLMAATLCYFVFEGVLIGTANSKAFHLSAVSGGGRGSTRHRENFGGGFYPYLLGQKMVAGRGGTHLHGGPIPVGKYMIDFPLYHSHLGLSARLTPGHANAMMHRGGFYIHGRGPHGSDGCIVPLSRFGALMDALKCEPHGTLTVVMAQGDSHMG
jgi:hypothetical protein